MLQITLRLKKKLASEGDSSSFNSSDDDITDEETFSTLAAFCQAKVTAVYNGIPRDDTSSEIHNVQYQFNNRKTSVGVDMKTSSNKNVIRIYSKSDEVTFSNTAKPIMSVLRIDPPPAKKTKLAQPNRVKVDLSMPLCSPRKFPMTSNSKIKSKLAEEPEQMSPEASPKSKIIVAFSANLPPVSGEIKPNYTRNEDICTVSTKPDQERSFPSVTSNMQTRQLNPEDREGTQIDQSHHTITRENKASPARYIYLPKDYSARSLAMASSGRSLFLPNTPQMPVPFTQLKDGSGRTIMTPQRFLHTGDLSLAPNPGKCTMTGSNFGLVPVTAVAALTNKVQPSKVTVSSEARRYAEKPTFIINTSITQNAVQRSVSKADAEPGKPEECQGGQSAVAADTQSVQRLPSIDQIFKPRAKTSLAASTVASASRVSLVPTIHKNMYVPSHMDTPETATVVAVQAAYVPTEISRVGYPSNMSIESMHVYEDNKNDFHKRTIKATHSNMASDDMSQTSPYSGWNRYPAINKVTYLYPASYPNPVRWPSPIAWPHYLPTAGRYRPYYPSGIPSCNTYPHSISTNFR